VRELVSAEPGALQTLLGCRVECAPTVKMMRCNPVTRRAAPSTQCFALARPVKGSV
jgi:hypothetical protein